MLLPLLDTSGILVTIPTTDFPMHMQSRLPLLMISFFNIKVKIINNNKFNIRIALVPYGNAHLCITIMQLKITDKFTIVLRLSLSLRFQRQKSLFQSILMVIYESLSYM